eukprot:m.44436 g.44436  ORF g.44436 m.44436 type:complete len:177 (+) comp11707_c0_seq1:22-552(+)
MAAVKDNRSLLLRVVLLGFFVSHIPITLLVDIQPIMPQDLYPQEVKDLLAWYVDTYHDPWMGMRPPPAWFESFVTCELFIQLPSFFIITYALLTGGYWVRIPGIIYGIHVATTVVPLLAEILKTDYKPGHGPQTPEERYKLVGFYLPYFLFPLVTALTLWFKPQLLVIVPEKQKKA